MCPQLYIQGCSPEETEKTVTIETRMEGPKTKKVMTDNEGKQYFTRLVDIRCYVKFGRVK